ncbi:MAG: 2-hydroxyacyl-CoA dehydratase family protein [Proteobacteria bacterium]|nr:2-hydroxyacyl-CoA dehydratase family protein [Pseudomonadota bacterium]
MMDAFYEAASKIDSQPIRSWKERGGKIVGYTCSYVPSEIFHAADILPVRLRGIETESMEIADAYFGPYICTFPKCILQLAGKGKYTFMDGVIITPGCDSMRRLDECWRKAGDTHPGIVPDFFYYFDVPHKTTEHGIQWFMEEINHMISALENQFNVSITPEKLQSSIREFNRGRKLLQELEDMRAKTDIVISGTDAYAVTMAGTVMHRNEFTVLLENLVKELKQKKAAKNDKRKRIMVIGSISDDISLIQLVEKENEAVVVAENLCFGVRYEGAEISENDDAVSALAHAYLGESKCPRMYGKYKERLASLKQIIDRTHIDGVIMQNVRFCDLHGSENGLFERDLEKEGIPCLRIEREYGPLVETGRLKMRIDAFFERLYK